MASKEEQKRVAEDLAATEDFLSNFARFVPGNAYFIVCDNIESAGAFKMYWHVVKRTPKTAVVIASYQQDFEKVERSMFREHTVKIHRDSYNKTEYIKGGYSRNDVTAKQKA